MKTTDSISRLPAVPARSPMKITRRFAVATLLVIAVAIVLGAPAPASAGQRTYVTYVKLYPAADSPLPHATGTLTLYQDRGPIYYSAVGVSVSRLAPNTSYYMPLYMYDPVRWQWLWYTVGIQTDRRGNWQGPGRLPQGFRVVSTSPFEVYDSATGALVLTPIR